MLKLACNINPTDKSAKLGLEIWLDKKQILNIDHVDAAMPFEYFIDNAPGNYQLRFVMKNKISAHTQIDSNGNIIKDACLEITNITVDDFEIHEIDRMTVYTHNFNGNSATTQSKFYHTMGCNGTLTLDFSVPVYDWLVKDFFARY
jgi:hypothetical protein